MGILITATRTASGSVTKFWAPAYLYESACKSFGEGWQISIEPCSRRPKAVLHINERI